MRRRSRRDRPCQRARLMGKGERFSDEEGLARIARRLPSALADVDTSIVDAIAGQFDDVPVGNGCVPRHRLRPDRLYVEALVLRRAAALPPRKIAQVLGLSRPFVKHALERGKALVEQARLDGRLDAALATLESQRLSDEDDDDR